MLINPYSYSTSYITGKCDKTTVCHVVHVNRYGVSNLYYQQGETRPTPVFNSWYWHDMDKEAGFPSVIIIVEPVVLHKYLSNQQQFGNTIRSQNSLHGNFLCDIYSFGVTVKFNVYIWKKDSEENDKPSSKRIEN